MRARRYERAARLSHSRRARSCPPLSPPCGPADRSRIVARGRPARLADATIFVPTRRAARALLTRIRPSRKVGAHCALPKIRPLGAVDEDAEMFGAPAGRGFRFRSRHSDAIGELPRASCSPGFTLGARPARRHRRRGSGRRAGYRRATSPARRRDPTDAIALAGDLGRLIDEFIIEGAEWSGCLAPRCREQRPLLGRHRRVSKSLSRHGPAFAKLWVAGRSRTARPG